MASTQEYLESAQSSINDALIILGRGSQLDVPGKLREASTDIDIAAAELLNKLERAQNLTKTSTT